MEDRNRTIERLKEKGIVPTPQRIAILQLIKEKEQHFTADEIYHIVKENYPSISFATVYNNLEKLVEGGEISQLSIRKDKASYISCYDWDTSNHHHFFCNSCKKLYDVQLVCPYANAVEFNGHKITDRAAYLYGICKDCRKD